MRLYVRIAQYIVMGVMIIMAACSPKWHVGRIIKKDPDYFKLDTVTKITTIKPELETFEIDCFELTKTPLVIQGTEYDKSPVIRLIPVDSGKIRAEVECPPVEIIERKVPEPYPVYTPSKSEKWKYRFQGAGVGGVILLILVIIVAVKVGLRLNK